MEAALWIVRGAAVYAIIGVFFSVWFVTRGIGRVDPATTGSTWGFRAMITPACCALWPLAFFWLLRGRSWKGSES